MELTGELTESKLRGSESVLRQAERVASLFSVRDVTRQPAKFERPNVCYLGGTGGTEGKKKWNLI